MNELIVFPDTVAALIAVVAARLDEIIAGDPVPVHGDVPTDRPDRFVTISRTGGTEENLVVDAAQITIEAWSTSEGEAHDLAQAARAIIKATRGTVAADVTFYRVAEFSGPASLPDPESDQFRFTWTM